MERIGGCRKCGRCRGCHLTRFSIIAALWMLALAAAAAAATAAAAEAAAAAADRTHEAVADASSAAAASATALSAIKKRAIVETGRSLGQPTSFSAVKTAGLFLTHASSGLPTCSPHHVQPPNWFGQRNVYINATESGCSLIVGKPTGTASENAAHRPPLAALWLYDDRHPIQTRHELRADGRHRCSATVSLLPPSPPSGGSDDPSPSLMPNSEPSPFAQVTDTAGRNDHRRPLNRTRSGCNGPRGVRSFRVNNRMQSRFPIWTSSAVRVDLRGACEPQVQTPHFRRNSSDREQGSLRISVSNYPEAKSICQEREDATAATTSQQPLPIDTLFANDLRFQFLLPQRLRCQGRADYMAKVRAQYIIVRSVPHPASCRRLCVADRCGSGLKGMVLVGEPADGGWVNVRYESLKHGSTAQHRTGTTASACAHVPPGHEKDDDKREQDEGYEDPDADYDADLNGNSVVSTSGSATQAVATNCRNDVYSGFALLLLPGGTAYVLP